MDFTKFFSLISKQSLFLCRADLLGDPFEGSYSKANIKLRPDVYKNVPQSVREQLQQKMSDIAKWLRQWTYVNCWYLSDHESAAMWSLYAKTNEAVAIQTTYKELTDSLPGDVFIGLVQYIDYEKDWLPEGNAFYPFMYKRKSFAHEREVRLVAQKIPTSEKVVDVDKPNDLDGIAVKFDLNFLIQKVYVAPIAPKWYLELVREVLRKYETDKTVCSSKLDEEPVY